MVLKVYLTTPERRVVGQRFNVEFRGELILSDIIGDPAKQIARALLKRRLRSRFRFFIRRPSDFPSLAWLRSDCRLYQSWYQAPDPAQESVPLVFRNPVRLRLRRQAG